MTGGNLAYIMSRFPHLPETFILREMQEMEQLGWKVSIFPLVFQKQSLVHPQARNFIPKVVHTPILSLAAHFIQFSRFHKAPGEILLLVCKNDQESSGKFQIPCTRFGGLSRQCLDG